MTTVWSAWDAWSCEVLKNANTVVDDQGYELFVIETLDIE